MKRSVKLSRRGFLQKSAIAAALPATLLVRQAASAPTEKSHKYEDLLPEDFYAELERTPIIYWGCGAMEEHGLQCALGTDLYSAYEICLRAVKISGGIVFPPVPFAMAGAPPSMTRRELREKTKELYPPSLWVSAELCKQLYTELMESFADTGFKSCIALGGHGPAAAMLKQMTQNLGGKIGAMKFWGGGEGSLMPEFLAEMEKKYPSSTGHGMMLETSTDMALHPQWVDLSRTGRVKTYSRASQLKRQTQKNLDVIAQANAEVGNRALDLAAERVAKLAREMLA